MQKEYDNTRVTALAPPNSRHTYSALVLTPFWHLSVAVPQTLLQIKNQFLVETGQVDRRGQKILVLTDSAVLGKPVLLQNAVNRRIGQVERMHQMKKMARIAQKLMK